MINFGECLKQLLTIRGWSAAQLSRYLNIDSSYVRKWLRGERVPAIKSDYIEKITYFISRGLDSDAQKYALQCLIRNVFPQNVPFQADASTQEIVNLLLKNSQLYSLSANSVSEIKSNELLQREISHILERDEKAPNATNLPEGISINFPQYSTIPALIHGRKSILEAVLFLFQAALNSSHESEKEMFITFQSENSLFYGMDEYYSLWKTLLTKALESGWKVHFLYRLDSSTKRIQELVTEIFSFSCYAGCFLPSYFGKYGIIAPSSELIVISGFGAFMCFASDSRDYVDSAIFSREKAAIEALYSHARLMYRETRPLLTALSSQEEYFKFVTQKDKQPGDFLIASFDLYTHTVPLELWKKYLKRSIGSSEDINIHLERIGERIKLFNEDVKRYKIKYICEMKAIDYLVRNGKYLYFTPYQQCTPEEVLEHLENTLLLLITHENFEIALLSDNQSSMLPFTPWEVKGGHTVVLTAFDKRTSFSARHMAITEATAAHAFHDYFMDIWEQINPKYRDKAQVIAWFQNQIRWYKENMLNER